MSTKRIIDYRSDTFTEPDATMRRIISEAVVGDDVWGEDSTVQELETYIADLLGKESALFLPSGTMANLVATTVHCQGLFSEIIMAEDSHTSRHELGNCVVARCHPRQVTSEPDGTISLENLKKAIQTPHVNSTTTRVIYLENTHNARGGKVLPISYLHAVRNLANEHGLRMHCDGARVWNAAIALNVPVRELAEPFDTISVCCSKGLGAPIGSLLAGSKAFIEDARRARKMYGGGMRQVGIIAAAALYAVQHMYGRLQEDHDWCQHLGAELSKLGFDVVPSQTNILLWTVAAEKIDQFLKRCQEEGLLLAAMGPSLVRAIPHYGNKPDDVEVAAQIAGKVARELGL